ncbi:unnamed protein product, partial [Rotaria magnacalcarata]
MDLRDEAFYDFIRQFAGRKVAELMSFQECNSVDSFLGCNDIFAILHLDSDEIFNLKKSMCITLNDGSIYLLPGVEASVNNLTKLFKKKREELLKQSQRRQSITIASVSSVPNIMSTNLATPPVIVDNYSINSSTSNISSDLNQGISPSMTHLLTYEIKSRIVNTVIEWLKQNSEKLSLVNMNFQEDIDFKVELNNSEDGIIIRCKCGTKHAIGQGRGVLVVQDNTIILYQDLITDL